MSNAALTLAVDSRPVDAATAAINRMTATTKPAVDALARMQKTAGDASAGLSKTAGGLNDMTRAGNAAAAALDRGTAAFNAHANAGQRASNVIALNANAMKNLMYQANDIVTMGLSGSSPFQIMATQGGQVLQVLQGANGGVTGALKDLGGRLAGIITPARLAAGGVAAIAVTGIAAWSEWQNKIDSLTRSLNGAGAAGGMTASTLAQIAMTRGGRLSAGDSFTAAGSYAGAGMSAGMTAGLLSSTNKFSNAFGIDKSEAIDELTKAFADPARGAQDLAKRFGVFGNEIEQQIRRQQAVGDLEGARQTLLREFNSSLGRTTDTTSALSKAMTGASNAASYFMSKFGKSLSGPSPLESLEAGLKNQGGVFRMGTFANPAGAADRVDVLKLWEKVFEETAPKLRAAADAEAKRQSYIDAANKNILTDAAAAAGMITARTAAERLSIEQQRIRNQVTADGTKASTADAEATRARTLAVADATRALMDNARAVSDMQGTARMNERQRIDRELDIKYRNLSERTDVLSGGDSVARAPIAKIGGLAGDFADKLQRFVSAIPGLSITDGFRTAAQQADLYRRKPHLAAPQGSSNHEYGLAADLAFATPEARAAAHDRAGEFGLRFPLKDRARNPEDWHVEPIDARARRLEIQSGGPREVSVTGRPAPSVGGDKERERQELYEQAWLPALTAANKEIERQVRMTEIQRDTFGKSTFEITRQTEAARRRMEIEQKGFTVTSEISTALDQYASAAGRAAQAQEDLNRQQRKIIEFSDSVRGTASDLLSSPLKAIANHEKPGEALRQAGLRAGGKLIDMGVSSLTEAVLGPMGKPLAGFFGGDKSTGTMDVKAGVVNVDGGLGGSLGNLAKSASDGGGLSKIFYSIFGGGTGGLYANGAAFHHGNVVPFAMGGVTDQPTFFPMAGGQTGVMGEAGPEGIMPLHRGRDGKLGVRAQIPDGRSIPAGLERAMKSISAGAQHRSAGNVTIAGDTNITVQGNADEKVLARMQSELDQRDRNLLKLVQSNVNNWHDRNNRLYGQ